MLDNNIPCSNTPFCLCGQGQEKGLGPACPTVTALLPAFRVRCGGRRWAGVPGPLIHPSESSFAAADPTTPRRAVAVDNPAAVAVALAVAAAAAADAPVSGAPRPPPGLPTIDDFILRMQQQQQQNSGPGVASGDLARSDGGPPVAALGLATRQHRNRGGCVGVTGESGC